MLNELRAGKRIIQAPMGAGKTLVSLKRIYDGYGKWNRTLIVAPLLIAKSVWGEEIKKFGLDDKLNYAYIDGSVSPKKKQEILEDESINVVAVSRDSVWRINIPPSFDVMILDEITSFKQSTSKRSKGVFNLCKRMRFVWGFSGSLFSSGFEIFYGIMQSVGLGHLLAKSKTDFYQKYFFCTKTTPTGIPIMWAVKNRKEILDIITPSICVIENKELSFDEGEFHVHNIQIHLPNKFKKIYDDFLETNVITVLDTDVSVSDPLTLINKLKQLSSGFIYDEEKNATTYHKEKLNALKELIEKTDENIIVFVRFVYELELLKNELNATLFDAKKIADWNNKKIKLMACNPMSMGHGLNLQDGGHIIVWYSLPDSLELYEQANARIFRNGQTQPVICYHLLSEGTIDTKLEFSLSKKQFNASMILSSYKRKIKN